MTEEELEAKLDGKDKEQLQKIKENLEQKLEKEMRIGAWVIPRSQATSKNNSKTPTATPSKEDNSQHPSKTA